MHRAYVIELSTNDVVGSLALQPQRICLNTEHSALIISYGNR